MNLILMNSMIYHILLLLILGHIVNGEIAKFRRLTRIFDKVHDHRDPYNASNATAINILFNLPEMNTNNYTAIYFNENVKYTVILVHVVCNRQYEKCGSLEMGNFVELDSRENDLVLRYREDVNPESGKYFHYVLPAGSKDHPLILRYILKDYDKKFNGFYNVSILPPYEKQPESGCPKPSYKEIVLPVDNKDTSMCMDCFSPIVSDYVAKFNEPLAKNQTCVINPGSQTKENTNAKDEGSKATLIRNIGIGVSVPAVCIVIGIIVVRYIRRSRKRANNRPQGYVEEVVMPLNDLQISRESETNTGPQDYVEAVAVPLNDRNHEGHVESESLTLKAPKRELDSV